MNSVIHSHVPALLVGLTSVLGAAPAPLWAQAESSVQSTTMLRSVPNSGFTVTTLFTVGDDIGGYRPYLIRLEHLNLGNSWDDKRRVSAWLAKLKARPSYQTAIVHWLTEPALDIMQAEGSKAWPIVRNILEQ